MASGTITLPVTTTDDLPYIKYQVAWTSTPNTSTNTTSVTLKYQVSTGDGSFQTKTVYDIWTTVWDNVEETRLDEYMYVTPSALTVGVNWVTISTYTFTLTHDVYGNKPDFTLNISISGSDDGTFGYDNSATITIDNIDRKATITFAPNFTDEDNPTIKYTNPLGNAATALEAAIYDTSGNTSYASYRSISKTGTSYKFNLTTAERNKLIAAAGNNPTLNVRFYVRTTIPSGTRLSSIITVMTINAEGPTITASIEDINSITVALTGGGTKFIRGRNSMSYSMTAEGKKGATISSYSVICGSKSSSSASGTLTNIENDVVIFSATDSRGITATKTIQLDAVEYVKLTCNQSVRMILEDDNSAQIELTISGNYFNGSFGAKSNTLALYVRHSRNDGAMNDWVDLSPLGYTMNGNTYSLTTDMSGFDPSGTYTFQCKAVDALGTVTTAEYAVKFTPVFDWSKSDFNFNVPVTIKGDLTITGTLSQGSSPVADYIVSAGTASMGTNGTWYWRKWNSGRADCYGVRNYGNMAVTTAWGGLYRSESFSQSLPSGLFIDTPEVIDINYRVSNYGGWIAQHEATAPSSSSTGGFIVVRPASATLSSAHIGFNVIGRWY